MSKLIFVESPTKAKTIRKFLKGFFVFATYGHLLDLPEKEFGLYLQGNKIEAKYLPLKGKNKIIKKIKEITKKFKEIYLATDPDREGEMIAEEIRMITGKNFLKRIVFYEIKPQALFEALKKPMEIRESLVKAQKGRRFLDRIFGYSLSPLLWKIKKGISAGRVQSAALRLIVEREREIRNFKKEIYYLVFVKVKNFPLKFVLIDEKLKPLKIKEKELNKWKEKLKNLEHLKLEKIIEETKFIYPPLPLDTENLQRYAYQFLHFPPKKTMFLAQKLFELGKITYHRTDSHKINLKFSYKLKDLIEKEFGKEYFSFPRKIKEKLSFEAHEAVRPTNLKENLTGDFLKLWKLIWLFTLASHFQRTEYKEKKIVLRSESFLFLVINNQLLFEGFLKIFPQFSKIKFQDLPELKTNEIGEIEKIEFKKKGTKPPPRFNEASLIKELKRLGIGRPSTYVPVMEILKKRNYVKKEKFLMPTELGEKVYDFLIKNFPHLIDLNFTAKMENDLDQIALGEKDYEEFVIKFWQNLKA